MMLARLAIEFPLPAALVLIATIGAFLAMLRGVAAELSLAFALGPLIIFGVVAPQQALTGFANEQMHTVALLFILAGALRAAGSLELLSRRLLAPTKSVVLAAARLLPPVAALSGFLNNTPLVAMLIPEVRTFARRNGIAASRLLIPLSYACITGGMLTVIGTSTNLVVNGLVSEAGRTPIGFLEIGKIGLPICLVGVAYSIVAARWLLPDRPDVDAAFVDPEHFITELVVDAKGPLVGRRLAEVTGGGTVPLAPAEVLHEGQVIAAPGPDYVLAPNDRLAFVGPAAGILALRGIEGLSATSQHEFTLDDPRRSLFELLVSNRCPLLGRSVGDGTFRRHYNAAVLAVARHGERVTGNRLADWVLQAGDVLLVEAGSGFLERQRGSRDFYLITPREGERAPRPIRAWFGLLVLTLMVSVAAFGWLSMFKASLAAMVVLIVTRYVSLDLVKQSLELRVLLTIALAFGLGSALESSGLAGLFAVSLSHLGTSSPLVALLVIHLSTSLLTECVTNNAAAALMVPIALAIASEFGVSHTPFIVSVMVGASASFATPIGYTTNLMVTGPGGYRFADFLKVGIPMNLIVIVMTVCMVPWLFPF